VTARTSGVPNPSKRSTEIQWKRSRQWPPERRSWINHVSQVQTIPTTLPEQGSPLISTSQQMAALSKLALPLVLAQGATLMMSVIDLVMVGRLGTRAVAALGLSVFSNSFLLASVDGLVSSVRGVVARRRGERSTEPTCLPLNAGLLIALVVGVPLAVAFSVMSASFFARVSSDPEVAKIGVPVFSILCLAIPAAGMHKAFNGFWTGVEKPRVFMLIVLFMNSLNIVMNYALIFGHLGAPRLGAKGATISTALSLYVGVILNCVMVRRRFRNNGFLTMRPPKSLVMRITQLGLPINVTRFFMGAGYVIFLRFVGQVGTAELAATNVLVRVTLMLEIFATSLGMAAATLVSKTVGEGDLSRATQWGWSAAKMGITGITLMGLPIIFFPKVFLAFFLSDSYAISISVNPIRIEAAVTGIVSLMYIFGYALNSLGDGKRIMMICLLTQWLLFLPAVWLVGPHLHYGLLQLWLVQIGYGLLASVLVTALWIDGRWKRIKI
jgi:MATE family multidrug resistance protein